MTLLARLDAHGTDDPDFNEGHPEDRCPLARCERAVVEHPGHERFALGDGSAKWPHRRAALLDVISRKLTR